MPPDQPHRQAFRLAAFGLGVAVLIWIPIEDTTIWWVTLFSVLICTLAGGYAAVVFESRGGKSWFVFPFVGTIAGVLVTPLALFLMAFKTGIHGHGAPDFTPSQVEAVLQRFPVWVAIGFLVGAFASLWQKLR
jgi:hypothetical protein